MNQPQPGPQGPPGPQGLLSPGQDAQPNNAVRKGVEMAMNTRPPEPGEQNIYNVFVKAAAVNAGKIMESIKKRIGIGDKTDSLAQITVMIVERTHDQLAKMGVQVSDDVLREGGAEIMQFIHDKSGMKMNPQEQELAMRKGADLYLSNREKDGTLDMTGIDQLAAMLKGGEAGPPQAPVAPSGAAPVPQAPTGGGLL